MASMAFSQFSLVPRICRWHLSGSSIPCTNLLQIQDSRTSKRLIVAVSRKKVGEPLAQEASDGEVGDVVEKKARRSPTKRTRKKAVEESAVDMPAESSNLSVEEGLTTMNSEENVKKPRTRTRKKVLPVTGSLVEDGAEKVTRRKTKKKADEVDSSQVSEDIRSDHEGDPFALTVDDENDQELDLDIDEGEDISYTYGWPPLVCCFGAAQLAFVPWARPANRLIDYEIHDRMRDALWEPEKFVRASGGCASNVAIALASLGGKVAFMGKLGDDSWGQSLLYNMNISRVQTRSVRIDDKTATAVSRMKIIKSGNMRTINVKPCAEDCFSRSEINIDVLKEAKMFYFNTFSLLDRDMRSTAMQSIKIAKKLGNIIFYDLNLPLPLWQSGEETKMFIRRAWNESNVIEVTKQELEFLCGITPSENFDTRDNNRAKFNHYPPEVIAQLWHDDLKVLFVTNGTSKIHYYTKEHNGAVHGMEDAPLTPYTSDMSASGDGFVAGIMRMLTEQPELICDVGYLEHTIKYGISCGVIDQWLHARRLGFPAKEGMEVASDPHGIRSITETEYRTRVPVPAADEAEAVV